jgi:hypothetical protein
MIVAIIITILDRGRLIIGTLPAIPVGVTGFLGIKDVWNLVSIFPGNYTRETDLRRCV